MFSFPFETRNWKMKCYIIEGWLFPRIFFEINLKIPFVCKPALWLRGYPNLPYIQLAHFFSFTKKGDMFVLAIFILCCLYPFFFSF